MAETISIKDFYYGPNPFDFRLGGNRYIDFTLEFSGTPPATFDYTVNVHNEKDETAKSFTLTNVPVNPDGTGTIHIVWDGSVGVSAEAKAGVEAETETEDSTLDVGSYNIGAEVGASGFDNLNQEVCNGCSNNPPCGCTSGCP